MVTRRKFIKTLTAGAAASLAFNPLLAIGPQGQRKLKNIGFIEGIIEKELKGDWKAVLRETVNYGYTEIEIGGYMGESAKTFLRDCKDIGIKPVAGGALFSKNADEVNKSLDKLNALDLKYAVIYWPWLVGGPFELVDCKRSVDMLNSIGELCKEKGLVLCWHNHNKEFIPMNGGGLPFDFIMNHTDKDLIKCEMDIYWVQKGGANTLEMLKKYKGRYSILHVKDMAPGTEQDFACPGSGVIDFPSIFSEAADQGIEHYFVERDNVVNGMECLKTSAEYLKNVRYK
jgi:sugar phosphate isomerase/epimerase